MTLLAQQMAERRERILQAARDVIAERGFDGLTMRELAQAAGVTVPTIYNLIGSKDKVLFAAVEEQTERFMRGIERGAGDVIAVINANERELERAPDYYRSLLRLMMASEAAGPARANVGRALRGQIRGALGELAEEGSLESWVSLDALQDEIQSSLWALSLEWANGRLASEDRARRSVFAVGLMLLAVSRGEAREEFARIVRDHQPDGPSQTGIGNVTSMERRQ